MSRIIVGTAGHIDHGKSALVRALTGVDPDRLPEEKKRGITIDLGYAFLDEVAAIIDVPGHERLIRNMVAGASTIDFAVLVVAADDGIMPQTTEHLHILRLLGVRCGVVVMTKCDTVDSDWSNLVQDQIHEAVAGTFLMDAPVFRVDSISGKGIPEFREWLIHELTSLPPRDDRGVFRLPVDRVFVLKGRGTVITGTVLSGNVQKDTRLAVLPGGFDVRVKKVESHGCEVSAVSPGQRTALNLVGDTERLERGCTLTVPGALQETTRLKIVLELLPSVAPLKERQRVRFLIGTQEVIGRVQILEASARVCYAVLFLESAVVAVWGDRFVLRRYSPLETLGGGMVLEPFSSSITVKNKLNEIGFAKELHTSTVPEAVHVFLKWRGASGLSVDSLAVSFGMSPAMLHQSWTGEGLPEVQTIGGYVLPSSRLRILQEILISHVAGLHEKNPDSPGFSRTDVMPSGFSGVPDIVLDHLVQTLITAGTLQKDGAVFRDPRKQIVIAPLQQDINRAVLSLVKDGKFTPPSASVIAETLHYPSSDVERTLVLLDKLGQVRRLSLDLFFESDIFNSAIAAIREHFLHAQQLTVSDAVRILASSRKYVVPFLEHLDSLGITARDGSVRVKGRKY
ncbi:selenocysteine-specific translation elongation factor [candidate division KSB1 bacterium]|nr:MAG: selenocysteine-specific translation elongation factor [candidate division KSB1 bacterium]